MTKTEYEFRADRFEELRAAKPDAGDILTTKDGEPVPVFVENKPDRGKGAMRVVYTNALIDHDCTGWYLSPEKNGLKVLILPRSQDRLIERNGGSIEGLSVSELRVIRQNEKGTALICELVDIDMDEGDIDPRGLDPNFDDRGW